MANAREILDRIKSINDTKKITSAMYLISSSKLKKARNSLLATEPYFFAVQSAIAGILNHTDNNLIHERYFEDRSKKTDEQKTKAYIIVTADKGLAGAYNHNVIKLAEQQVKKHTSNKLYVIGEVGKHHFQNKGLKMEETFCYNLQNPSMNRARNIAETMLEEYLQGNLDEVYIIYTKMINSMSSQAEMIKLLPLNREYFNESEENFLDSDKYTNYTFIPSAHSVFKTIVPNWISGLIYGALVESYCSEQNARMMAMQASTDNANEMLRELAIVYNRVRQAAITQEITEVISGAKAQKNKQERLGKK